MLTIAILAGGRSLRMGKNKANMLFQGRNLVRRIMERLAGLQGEMIIVGSGINEGIDQGIRILTDIYPNHGPLGGLHTALVEASNPIVACIACDMPFANPDLISFQRDLLLSEDLDVVAPSTKNGIEPLHGVYRRETCLPAVKKALIAGEGRLVSWFPDVRVRILVQNEMNKFDLKGLTFININTPEELEKAEAFEQGLIKREMDGK
jgi:molybdopterin-guanine dinucleotide biosynthesis protein A